MAIILEFSNDRLAHNINWNWYVQEHCNALDNKMAIANYQSIFDSHAQGLYFAAMKREERINRIGRMCL